MRWRYAGQVVTAVGILCLRCQYLRGAQGVGDAYDGREPAPAPAGRCWPARAALHLPVVSRLNPSASSSSTVSFTAHFGAPLKGGFALRMGFGSPSVQSSTKMPGRPCTGFAATSSCVTPGSMPISASTRLRSTTVRGRAVWGTRRAVGHGGSVGRGEKWWGASSPLRGAGEQDGKAHRSRRAWWVLFHGLPADRR